MSRIIAVNVPNEKIKDILADVIDLDKKFSTVAKFYGTSSKSVRQIVKLFHQLTPDEFHEWMCVRKFHLEMVSKEYTSKQIAAILKREWALYLKERAILEMGGRCQICGYHEDPVALDFHHINPSEKEYKITKIRTWERMASELEKCILVCSNCHRSIHSGTIALPEYYEKMQNQYD